jgi:hypothetical protein
MVTEPRHQIAVTWSTSAAEVIPDRRSAILRSTVAKQTIAAASSELSVDRQRDEI